MRIIKLAIFLGVVLSMSSCLMLGIDMSQDPKTQLTDAENLMECCTRPHLTESLIQRAMVTYEKRHDSYGLGNANLLYARFLESRLAANRAYYSKRLDTSIISDNQQEKIVGDRQEEIAEYYRKALQYYRVAEPQALAAGQYFTLSAEYVFMAWSHLGLGEKDAACENFDLSLHAYYEDMRLHPAAHKDNREWKTFPATIAGTKKWADCREAT
jgi:hypothetical protein